ncbi:hypothetical protein NDN08_005937 [Rhodosorus marinus]|uniref:Integrase catalytic domain-containing protein n=1 Tax=Rhodosorus marinus TaxID=101924 RepID=A0AAV8UNA1_9RHOD|nr:hypothetical protein NDN08_005937 [Rhodosorus marinus]
MGTVVIATTVGDRQQLITIEDVLYLPGIEGNYLSVPTIVKKGYSVNFDKKVCKFYEKGGAVVASAKLINSTYVLASWTTKSLQLNSVRDLSKLHRRLGHTGWQKVKQIQRASSTPDCETCTVTKLRRGSRAGTLAHASRPGETIHTDVCGKLPKSKGAEYWVTFTDEVSRLPKIYPIQRKNDVSEAFDEYMPYFERLSGQKVITVHSEGGGEYIGMQEKLKKLGITLDTTPPYSAETNGISERVNRSILMLMRVLLYQSGI